MRLWPAGSPARQPKVSLSRKLFCLARPDTQSMALPKVAAARQADVQRILKALSDAPRQIARIARGRVDRQLHRQPAPEAWSARDILAHLQACAEVWGHSIDRMLTEDHPTIRYVSPRGWLKKTNYLQQSFDDLLQDFSVERRVLVRRLSALDPVAWARGATFTSTTSGRAGTVLSYARRIADHETHHLDQFRRTLGASSARKTCLKRSPCRSRLGP